MRRPDTLALWACGCVLASACSRSALQADGIAGESVGADTTTAGSSASTGTGGSTSGAGGGSCEPVAESCNGQDDDCDGLVDEGDPGGGAPCETGGLGVCSTGMTACEAGVEVCVEPAGLPEVCDGIDNDCDGLSDEGAACTKRAFVTSQLFSSDLGGLAGADAKCQALADAAGLGGIYLAWLSDTMTSASQRMSHLAGPYVLIDGATVIADDWAELTGGDIQHAIDLTELGTAPPAGTNECEAATGEASVWTCTSDAGESACAESACADWTATGPGTCVMGSSGASLFWSAKCSGDLCAGTAALYCFEQ